MNWGLIRKNGVDALIPFLICLLGLSGFAFVFVWAMKGMGIALMNFVAQFPILTKMFEMGFGINVSEQVTYEMLFAVCFTHLITLALAWSFVISQSTRALVGEIENGTADFLLTLPVKRSEVFHSSVIVWIGLALILSFAPILGIGCATVLLGVSDQVHLSRYIPVSFCFFCLTFAVGGLSTFVSVVFNRRSYAVGVVVAICLTSAAIQFVEPFVSALKYVNLLNMLAWFRPVDILQSSTFPIKNILVLLGGGSLALTAALVHFIRRDIPAA